MSNQWEGRLGNTPPHLTCSIFWEYVMLVKPKNCASILAKRSLYLDQEGRKKPPQPEEVVFCPESPWLHLLTFPKKPLSFLSAQTLLPSPFPHTLPNLPAISSAPPATIDCSSHCLLSKSPTFAPSCSQPHRLVLTLVESHMTSGLLQSATGTDPTPVKSRYLLPERL